MSKYIKPQKQNENKQNLALQFNLQFNLFFFLIIINSLNQSDVKFEIKVLGSSQYLTPLNCSGVAVAPVPSQCDVAQMKH